MQKKIKYYLEYTLLIFYFYFSKIIGIRLSSLFGGIILLIFGKFSSKSKLALININKVFPNLSVKKKKAIVSKMWFHFGRIMGEYPHLDKINIEKNKNQVKVYNASNFKNSCKNNDNCIFFSAHIGNWELTSHPITQSGNSMWFIYRAPNNYLVDNLLSKIRIKYGVNLIKKGSEGARQCIRVLKTKKQNLGMLIDQKMNDGIKSNFFGYKVMTASAIAKFSIKFKCPIIPVLCIRTKGVNFNITYFPEIPYSHILKLKTEECIMNYLNTYVEKWIKDNPEQWMWAHNRW